MTQDLNLKHIRALSLIAARGSITAAADAIGLSQSALTQGVTKLEQQFGVRIFDRLSQGLRPTDVGLKVLERTERAVRHFSNAVSSSAISGRWGSRLELNVTGMQVRALLSLSEEGSLAEAGRLNRAGGSSLYRSLQELEHVVGVLLTERRGRGVVLNDVGRAVAREFALGMNELDVALQEVAQRPTRVVIGAMALSRSRLIPTALAELAGLDPLAQIDVMDGSYGELTEALRNGTIDMVIGTLREPAANDLRQETLLHDRITVVGRRGHPLEDAQPDLEELASFPWIVGRRTSALLEGWQKLFDEAGVTRPQAPIHCGSVTTIRGILVRSDFLTLLSRDQVQVELDAGLLAIIASKIPDTVRIIGVTTRRDWFPSPLQRLFLSVLQRVAVSMLPG